jgi:tyrosyl-tRNA synthetase
MNEFKFKSDLLLDLQERGFLYQTTDQQFLDDYLFLGKKLCFYAGVDPTAGSLHVGHLTLIFFIKKLMSRGHEPIILLGGATGQIGDPTWKDAARTMLEQETVQRNMQNISDTLNKLLVLDCEQTLRIVNNNDWISKLGFFDFLRSCGRFFSVNKMLTMDSVSSRIENNQHLSYLEFSYSLLQAYDFLHLFENYGCILQVGGADQWSNIISGVDLIKKRLSAEAVGLTFPLLASSKGTKMGKTEKGAVWLDQNLTTPFDFWQYWRNVDDRDVARYMKLFSDIPVCDIDSMVNTDDSMKMNNSKIALADAVTSFVHGPDCLESIHNTVASLYGGGSDVSAAALESVYVEQGAFCDSVLFKCGLASSMSDARRLIESSAVRIDGVVVTSIKHSISSPCVLSVGKKKFVKIEIPEIDKLI